MVARGEDRGRGAGPRGGMDHPMGCGLQERRPDQEPGKGHGGPGARLVAPVRGRAVSPALLTHLHSQSAYSVPEAFPGTWVATSQGTRSCRTRPGLDVGVRGGGEPGGRPKGLAGLGGCSRESHLSQRAS